MVWDNGVISAPAHGSLDGDLEDVLVALGGAMPLCLAVLDAWPLLADGVLLPDFDRLSGTRPGAALAGPYGSVDHVLYVLRTWPSLEERHGAALRGAPPGERRAVRDFFALGERHARALEVANLLPPSFEAMRLVAAVERSDLGRRYTSQLKRAVGRLARDCAEAAGIRPPKDLKPQWAGRVWARGAALVDGCFVLDLRPPVSEAEPWQAITPSGTRPWVPT